ncbi:MAG: hypothetical protein ACT4OP_03700 [Actinomycetota bacterium]
MSDWAIYGAYGYSGELAARRAAELGHRPLLLGRNAEKLAAWPVSWVFLTAPCRLTTAQGSVRRSAESQPSSTAPTVPGHLAADGRHLPSRSACSLIVLPAP